jgi:hydrogenase expression/formation protein HypE
MDTSRSNSPEFILSCPIPIQQYPEVLLAHGGGGKLTHELIGKMFEPAFRNDLLSSMHDGAVISLKSRRIAFTTDSYVVSPIFFPGGDIGELAVNGTVNDLAMCGARPLYLSCAFVIEEGLPMEDLSRIVTSMKQAAEQAGVQIVTGDTKVVDRGKGDKIFITTAGIGIVDEGVEISPSMATPGDLILLNGPIGLHGITILSVREGLRFETTIGSDTAALNHLVQDMISVSGNIHVLRDPTRGGVATTLNEIATQANVGISILQEQIPVTEEVRGACELLGLDPLYVANEGKLIAIVAKEDAGKVLDVMKRHPQGAGSCLIGEVVASHPGTVVMKTAIGGSRVVDMLSGEQLPRIC